MEKNIDTEEDEFVAKYPNDDIGVWKGHAPDGKLKETLKMLGGKPVEPLGSPRFPLSQQIER